MDKRISYGILKRCVELGTSKEATEMVFRKIADIGNTESYGGTLVNQLLLDLGGVALATGAVAGAQGLAGQGGDRIGA